MQTMTAGSDIFVRAGDGAVSAVVSFARERIALASPVALGLREFAIVIRNGINSVEIPFAGRPGGDGRMIDIAAESQTSPALTAVLSGASIDTALLRSMTDGEARPPARERSAGGALSTLAVLALCLVVGAYVAERVYTNATTIVPRAAYLSTGVSTMASPTSGRVSFIAGEGPVRSGEPVFGIDTNNGKTIFVDAAGDIEIVSQNVRLGARVTRGGAVLGVASDDPTTYLEAVVSRDEAFRLGHGTVASYLLLGAEGAVPTEIQIAPGAISATPVVDELGFSIDQLYKVRIPVASDGQLYDYAPVELSYTQTLTSRGEALLESFGAPTATIETLLSPLAWLSSAIGREV